MINYKEQFKKISHYISIEDYNSVTRKSTWLLEQGLKQLYIDQIEYFVSKECNSDKSYKAFTEIMEKEFANFDVDIATLGYLVKVYHVTRFFDLLQNRLDVRLTFTRKLPWKKIVSIRNSVTHGSFETRKEVALDFIHYIKVFIYETNIDDRYGDNYKAIKCHNCMTNVDSNWNYCANCGYDLSVKCKYCNEPLKQSWTICPKCKRPRSGLKLKDPSTLYRHYCEAVWADGVLTKEEKQFLYNKREELGLNVEEAQNIELIYTPIEAIRFRDAVEATLVDGIIDDDERVFLKRKSKELGVSEQIANEIFNACISVDIIKNLFAEGKDVITDVKD